MKTILYLCCALMLLVGCQQKRPLDYNEIKNQPIEGVESLKVQLGDRYYTVQAGEGLALFKVVVNDSVFLEARAKTPAGERTLAAYGMCQLFLDINGWFNCRNVGCKPTRTCDYMEYEPNLAWCLCMPVVHSIDSAFEKPDPKVTPPPIVVITEPLPPGGPDKL